MALAARLRFSSRLIKEPTRNLCRGLATQQTDAKRKIITRTIQPKDAFKHIILTRLLKAMSEKFQNGWTYMDLTPGPGRYTSIDGGLSLLYAHARKKFKNRETNFFNYYLTQIQRFNGETDAMKLKQVPPVGFEPGQYPSGAGFASMYLRSIDRAVFVENNPDFLSQLREEFKEGIAAHRVKVVDRGEGSHSALCKRHVPPINQRGMLTCDLDLMLELIHPANVQRGQQYSTHHTRTLSDMGSILAMLCKRWPSGTFFVPYPLTSYIPPISLVRDILRSGAKNVLNVSMYLEGNPEKADSASFGGSGVGALIVNPPPGVDLDLHKHMPGLKTEVFMPAILLDEDEKESEARVHWLLRKQQPWEHVSESPTKMTWEYFRKADWTREEQAEYDSNVRDNKDDEFKVWLQHNDDTWLDELYAGADKEPEAEPLDPKYQKDWTAGIRQQSQYQDPARPTVIKVPKNKKEEHKEEA